MNMINIKTMIYIWGNIKRSCFRWMKTKRKISKVFQSQVNDKITKKKVNRLIKQLALAAF